MRSTLLLMLFLLLYAPMLSLGEERKPNIVFFLADDLGYRDLGCFGQKLIKTPHIDQLAAQGMRLTQHYSGNAVCAPSRCVLMTGKHPGHAFIRNNQEVKPEGQYPIPDNEVTLAELLKGQGYVSGAFGKWGLGGPESSGQPLNQGIDRFFGYNCQRVAHSYYPSYLWSDREHFELNNVPAIDGHAQLAEAADPNDPKSYDIFKGQDYAPDRIVEQALLFVKSHQDKPFFLYYPSVIPHLALHVPDEELKPYLDLGWNDPPYPGSPPRSYTPHYTPRAAYAAMISKLDKNVGKILHLLDELNLSDDTIVVFSSDNGAICGWENEPKFFNSVGELRGIKGSLYEGGVRVPGIVRWPGRIAEGTESNRVSGFEDWLPTLLELIGAKEAIPNDVDGISMAPTLLGKNQAARPYLYREFPSYGGQQSIRVGDWKAVRQELMKGNQHIELYHLSNDISESHDVSKDHPEIVKELETLMLKARIPSAAFPFPFLDKLSATMASDR